MLSKNRKWSHDLKIAFGVKGYGYFQIIKKVKKTEKQKLKMQEVWKISTQKAGKTTDYVLYL